MSSDSKRNGKGFLSGTLIGALGGLIGLGGAEFRLPVLMGSFKMPTLEAVIFNKAMSLTVVAVALIFRTKSIATTSCLLILILSSICWPGALSVHGGQQEEP